MRIKLSLVIQKIGMYSRADYWFDRFVKSRNRTKKYTAILVHRRTGRKVQVHFGGVRPNGVPYGQYRDQALGLYSKWDNEDEDRRRSWLRRHAKDGFRPFSASYFAKKYLW